MNTLNIQPSEAWKLSYIEIINLIDKPPSAKNIDTSIMLNYEREKNGACKKWLQQQSN